MRLIDDETKNCSDHGVPTSKAAVGDATRRQTGDEVAGLFVTLAPAPAVSPSTPLCVNLSKMELRERSDMIHNIRNILTRDFADDTNFLSGEGHQTAGWMPGVNEILHE